MGRIETSFYLLPMIIVCMPDPSGSFQGQDTPGYQKKAEANYSPNGFG